MFQANLKKQRSPLSFDQQLEIKLKTLKNESHSKPNTRQAYQHDMAALLEDAVQELQRQDVFENALPAETTAHRHPPQKVYSKAESGFSEELEHRARQQGKKTVTDRNREKVNELGDHIWNLASKPDVIAFLKENFPDKRQNQSISTSEFVREAIQYYLGIQLTSQQVSKLKEIVKQDLTTTNHQVISLNALEILTKKVSLQHYVTQSYVQAQTKLKSSDMQRKNKKILEGVTNKIDDLVRKEQELEHRHRELLKLEATIADKERDVILKQKEILQREKEYKRSFEEKCVKMTQTYISQISSTIKEGEKRLAHLQNSIRNKMDLLDRKAENLKLIINQHSQLRAKKINTESEAKIRLRKVQKEYEVLTKKHKGQIEQLQNQEKELLRTLSAAEEKIAKSDKKNKKLKQKTENLQAELVTWKQTASKFQEQNRQLQQLLSEVKAKVPEQNVMQRVKIRQDTKRSSKSKAKKSQQDIASLICIYQHALSHAQLQKQSVSGGLQTIQLMKELLPLVVGQLCSEDEPEDQQRKPHQLVLFLSSMVAHHLYSQSLKGKESAQWLAHKIWSAELSQLLKMPFSPFVGSSLFLYLLPLLDWHHISSRAFFQKSIQQLISCIQNRQVNNHGLLELMQRGNICQVPFLLCVIVLFVNPLKQALWEASKEQLNIQLYLSSSIADLLLSASSHVSYAGNLGDQFILEALMTTFDALCRCIVNIYDAETGTERRRNQTIFECYELIQETAQKLSILLQRIIYHSVGKGEWPEKYGSIFSRIVDELSQLNRSNGMRHSLILANLTSISSMLKNQG